MREPLSIVFPMVGAVRSGGARVVAELSNGLVRRGHRVTLIWPGAHPFPFSLSEQVRGVQLGLDGRQRSLAGTMYDVFRAVPRDADVVVSSYYMSAFVGAAVRARFGIRHVYLIQGFEPSFFPPTAGGQIRASLAKLSYRLPGEFVAVSSWLRAEVGRISIRRIDVVPDGVDTSIFRPDGASRGASPATIVTLGWRLPRKGFWDVVGAVEQLWKVRQDFRVVVGTADTSLTADPRLPITFVCPADDAELADLYRQGDVFVSGSWTEGFGLPALEAMACGAALITTASGGVSDFAFDGQNALVVPVRDSDALSRALNRLLNSPSERERLSQNGVASAASFTWDRMIDRFEAILTR